MSLFSIGLFMFGSGIGMFVGAFIGHWAGYERGRRDYYGELVTRLKQEQRQKANQP